MQSQNAHIDLERFRIFYLFYPFLNNYVLITQKYLMYRQSCAQKMDPSSPGPSRLILKIKPVPFHGDACNMWRSLIQIPVSRELPIQPIMKIQHDLPIMIF